MEFSNQKRSKTIKQVFNITGIIIVLIGLVFLYFKLDTHVLITAGIFAMYVGISMYANLCYVSFSTENNKVSIKYFPIITLMKKEYESIEFPQNILVGFQIEKAMGFADLEIAIKTKKGIAEYPTISLAALSKQEIEKIRTSLEEIMKNNKSARILFK